MTVINSERRGEAAAPHPRAGRVSVPFTFVEEIWQLRNPPDETANIHLEVQVAGSLDEDRLREAIRTAVAIHPMARARQTARRLLLRAARWEIVESETDDILHSTDCAREAMVDVARVEFYDQPISLSRAPALRFLLARQPGGDVLMLNAHHAITDGVGALRFLHSVARAYAGRPDLVPNVDPLAARDPASCVGSLAARRLPKAESPSAPTGARAFVAPEGGRAGAGYGFVLATVLAEQTSRLNPRRLQPSATVNDLLQAALHLTIAEWNAQRNCRCDCVAIFMPANSRPAKRRDELVINQAIGAKVLSTPEQRKSAEVLLAAVTKQTRWIKSGSAAAAVFDLPRWALNLIPVLLPMISFLMGDRVENTAVLSNLGKLDELPDFGTDAGTSVGFGFSPPCGMPMGLSVGVAGVEGGLHLAFRYRRALFDDGAARRFARLFLDRLLSFAK